MSNMERYNDPSNYVPVMKKVFDRQVYMPEPGTEIFNHLEKSSYTVNDAKPYVLIGSKGEEWCVDRATLLKSYDLTETDLEKFTVGMEPQTITTRPGVLQWATHIDLSEQIQITSGWGEVMTSNIGDGHGSGDWIICQDKNGSPNFDDRWILNGEIFDQTIDFIQTQEHMQSDVMQYEEIAAFSIGRALGLDEEEQRQFADEVIGYIESKNISSNLRDAIEKLRESYDVEQMLTKEVANTITSLHNLNRDYFKEFSLDEFCNNGYDKAFDGNYHLFLPIELAGWNIAKDYIDCVTPTLDAIGVKLDNQTLKREFNDRTVALLQTCDAKNIQYVENLDTGTVYPITNDSVQDYIVSSHRNTFGVGIYLSNPSFVENKVMPALMERGFGCDLELMDRVEKLGLDCLGDCGRNDRDIGETPGNRD